MFLSVLFMRVVCIYILLSFFAFSTFFMFDLKTLSTCNIYLPLHPNNLNNSSFHYSPVTPKQLKYSF